MKFDLGIGDSVWLGSGKGNRMEIVDLIRQEGVDVVLCTEEGVPGRKWFPRDDLTDRDPASSYGSSGTRFA